jgi:hypothetical protein
MPASASTDDLGDAFNIDLSITDAGDDLSTITGPLPLEEPSSSDVWAVDHSDSDGDEFTFVDPVPLEGRDFARFQKLAAHLGGLSINIWTYEAQFGGVTAASPFGDRVWQGLSALYGAYPQPNKIHGDVAWLGWFVSPELFSKSTAASPISAAAPSMAWLTHNSYPAVFVLDQRQHNCLTDTVIGPHRVGRQPSDIDFYDGLELHGHTKLACAENMSDPWSIAGWTVLEYDSCTFGIVQMLCLKILIAGSRPWYVHASRLRLYKPLSRL